MDIQVAIIGAGVIGKRVSSFFYKDAGLPIKWICDLDIKEAKDLAEQYGANYTDDVNLIINDKEVNIVYIGVPPKYHKEIAVAALEANKHVLCEKPLAMDSVETSEMIMAANISGNVSAVNLPFRFTPAVLRIKQLLSEDYFGAIKRLELKFRFPSWPRGWQQNAWLAKREQGGAIREVGTHFIFLINELEPWLGKISKVWSKILYKNNDGSEWSCNALLQFSSGLICTFDLLVETPEPEENTLLIIGENKIISFEMWNDLYTIQPDGNKKLVPLTRNETSPIVVTFINEIKGIQGAIPSVSFADTAKTQRIIDIILKSYEKWIEIS